MTITEIRKGLPEDVRETMAEAFGNSAKSSLLGRGGFALKLAHFLETGAGAETVCVELTAMDEAQLGALFARMADRDGDPVFQALYLDLAALMLEREIAATRERMELDALFRRSGDVG